MAFELYCRLPFGRIHSHDPEIIRYADAIGRTPSSMAMRLANIASVDPKITSSGRRGLQGGASRDVRAMWEEMNSNWDVFVKDSTRALEDFGIAPKSSYIAVEDENDLPERIGKNYDIRTTARRGQDFFRSAVLSAYNQRCCITGLSIPSLLVASHIVPWRIDILNRVNPKNGLLLSVLHDRAFDKGLIAINTDYTLLVSPRALSDYPDDGFFSSSIIAYQGHQIRLPEKFAPDHEFLAYHRDNIFLR